MSIQTEYTDHRQKRKSQKHYPLPLPSPAQMRFLRRVLNPPPGRDGWAIPDGDQHASAEALFSMGYLERRLTNYSVRLGPPYTTPAYNFTHEFRLDQRPHIGHWVRVLIEGIPAKMEEALQG